MLFQRTASGTIQPKPFPNVRSALHETYVYWLKGEAISAMKGEGARECYLHPTNQKYLVKINARKALPRLVQVKVEAMLIDQTRTICEA